MIKCLEGLMRLMQVIKLTNARTPKQYEVLEVQEMKIEDQDKVERMRLDDAFRHAHELVQARSQAILDAADLCDARIQELSLEVCEFLRSEMPLPTDTKLNELLQEIQGFEYAAKAIRAVAEGKLNVQK